ncbi:hypothetical protein HDU97_004259 [Phlyctochytrium planicorne]|nr:hypothetical protein HDU97_004259 [Phlyctochytrium planicorne]
MRLSTILLVSASLCSQLVLASSAWGFANPDLSIPQQRPDFVKDSERYGIPQAPPGSTHRESQKEVQGASNTDSRASQPAKGFSQVDGSNPSAPATFIKAFENPKAINPPKFEEKDESTSRTSLVKGFSSTSNKISTDEFPKDSPFSYTDGSSYGDGNEPVQRGSWREDSIPDAPPPSFVSSERATEEQPQGGFWRESHHDTVESFQEPAKDSWTEAFSNSEGSWTKAFSGESEERTVKPEKLDGFDAFHPPREPVRAVDVKEGKFPDSSQLVGVAPARWVGGSLKGSSFKNNAVATAPEEDKKTSNSSTPDFPEFLKYGKAYPPLTNCQTDLMLKLAAYYETTDSNLYYDRCEMVDRHHGLAAGYIDLTSNQGSLEVVIKRYVETLGAGVENPFKQWMELLADTASGNVNPDDIVYFEGFCDEWEKVSKDTAFRKAYDSVVVDLYITPTFSAASALHLTQPLSITILFDSMVHLGHKLLDSKIIPNITQEMTTVSRDQDAINWEAVWISKMILLRQQYRLKSDEARKKAITEEDFEYEWDTSPDGVWEKGLAAFASLIVANGKERDGVVKSLKMEGESLKFAGDVEGTKSVTVSCDKPLDAGSSKVGGMKVGSLRASDPDLVKQNDDQDKKNGKPVGSWQKIGKVTAGAAGLIGGVQSVVTAGAVALIALLL